MLLHHLRGESADGQRSRVRRAAPPSRRCRGSGWQRFPGAACPPPTPAPLLPFLPRLCPGPLLPPRPAPLPPTATGLSPGSRGSRPAAAAPLTSSPPARRAVPGAPHARPLPTADRGQIASAVSRFAAGPAGEDAPRGQGRKPPRCAGSRSCPAGTRRLPRPPGWPRWVLRAGRDHRCSPRALPGESKGQGPVLGQPHSSAKAPREPYWAFDALWKLN